ncbi:hypothetical protein [Rhodopirellula bahusiensis]|uniref:hypothetical protein n=1 Tax=Rhodopirellula bahusiensis TaxID=2014065 RepID=UPI00326526D1
MKSPLVKIAHHWQISNFKRGNTFLPSLRDSLTQPLSRLIFRRVCPQAKRNASKTQEKEDTNNQGTAKQKTNYMRILKTLGLPHSDDGVQRQPRVDQKTENYRPNSSKRQIVRYLGHFGAKLKRKFQPNKKKASPNCNKTK